MSKCHILIVNFKIINYFIFPYDDIQTTEKSELYQGDQKMRVRVSLA